MASPAALEPAPFVTRLRSFTVAKVDSIGLVVRRCFQWSAGKSGIECQIGSNQLIDLTARPGSPRSTDGANRTPTRSETAFARPSHGQHDMTDLEIGRIADLRRRQIGALDAQYRQIRPGVASGDGCRNGLTTRQGYGDALIALDRMVGGHDDALTPVHAAG